MRKLLIFASAIALVLVIGPPLLYLARGADVLAKEMMKILMIVGTILWFATVPFWMGRSSRE